MGFWSALTKLTPDKFSSFVAEFSTYSGDSINFKEFVSQPEPPLVLPFQ
jgi:hypothetical protein